MVEKKVSKKINREFSAGGIVFRKFNIHDSRFEIKWLVSKSNPSKNYPQSVWRFPKGWLDDSNGGKQPGPFALGKIKASKKVVQIAALKEVAEEGGVKARIIKQIATEKIFFTRRESNQKVLKFITFFLMEWEKDIGFGEETAEVGWLSYENARKILSYLGEKKLLDKAKAILDSV